MSNSDDLNQCQGCQAGWPIEKHFPWPKGSKPMLFHRVVGGYRGERSVCTKREYGNKKNG